MCNVYNTVDVLMLVGDKKLGYENGAHLKETKAIEAFLVWEGAREKKGRTF